MRYSFNIKQFIQMINSPTIFLMSKTNEQLTGVQIECNNLWIFSYEVMTYRCILEV